MPTFVSLTVSPACGACFPREEILTAGAVQVRALQSDTPRPYATYSASAFITIATTVAPGSCTPIV